MNPRRVTTIAGAVWLLLAAGLAVGAEADVDTDRTLVFDPAAADLAPSVQIVSGSGGALTLEFVLPSLEREEIVRADGTGTLLTIAGGGFASQTGGLTVPTFTRLVAVPDGAVVQTRIGTVERIGLPEVELLPWSDAELGPAATASSEGMDDLTADQLVTVGPPARLRGLQVVPVTFRPVKYDPLRGVVEVATRIEVELTDRNGQPLTASAAAPDPNRLPSSFADLYDDVVVNYDGERGTEGSTGYLMICPSDAAVIAALEPLLEWRRRQGYTVRLATLLETGSTRDQIKAFIQTFYDTSEVPLEFVVLAGDATGSYVVPCWFENQSGYHGEGDHYYTMLDGDDILADVHIGRLSFRTLASLADIVQKIVPYEKNPTDDLDPEWFTRGYVVGDPSASGQSTITVSQWCRVQMIDNGYTEVQTTFYGNFAALMVAGLNRGDSIFTYRGWWGSSGFGNGHVSLLTNAPKLPFAVVITCGTGSFSSYTTALSEAFLRQPGGGAVACIGTATPGTHTRYNNCMYYGILEGVLNSGEHRAGPALTRGKLEMYNNYQLSEPNKVEIWSVWNNLMGDPATDIWTSRPVPMTVTHPTELATGANSLPVIVTDVEGQPLAAIRVAVYQPDGGSATALTDAAGLVNLPLDGFVAGPFEVTAFQHRMRPYLGSAELGTAPVFVNLAALTVSDDGTDGSVGNGDGEVNPGETLALAAQLINLGVLPTGGVSATLATRDPYVSLLTTDVRYGDLAAGASAGGAEPFLVAVAAAAPAGHVVTIDLTATSDDGQWVSLIALPVAGSALEAVGYIYTSVGGNTPEPGSSGSVTIELLNHGSLPVAGATATLSTRSRWVTVTDPTGSYGAIEVDEVVGNGADPFAIAVADEAIVGHLATFTVALALASGAVDTTTIQVTLGEPTSTDPVGPDGYGYRAFDNTDIGYPYAPVYEWVEIDPSLGGMGTGLGLTDHGQYEDDTETVQLPFVFSYYGQEYDRVSICSNGWIAMGATALTNYRNWSIPCAGAPDALIAPFWDDLYLSTTQGGVFLWYDEVGGRVVIEYGRVRNRYNSALEDFQVILYDPAVHGTETGDGLIVFQYQVIANVDPINGYGTVGIMNQDRSDGVLYTYWNQYPPAAVPLSGGRAIAFVPLRLEQSQSTGVDTAELPAAVALAPNFPNPFNPTTQIRFGLPTDQRVALRVYDVQGRLVATLAERSLPAGHHQVTWHGVDDNGSPVASGTYVYRLETETGVVTRKMTLV